MLEVMGANCTRHPRESEPIVVGSWQDKATPARKGQPILVSLVWLRIVFTAFPRLTLRQGQLQHDCIAGGDMGAQIIALAQTHTFEPRRFI